jgi:N-acetylglucosamine malate deacetylase 2
MIIQILLAALLGIMLLWAATIFVVNDFSVKTIAPKARRLLVIYPHPDDEALTCSGLMQKLTEKGTEVTLAVLTKGEKGNPDGKKDEHLREIRALEARIVSRILGAKLLHYDMGDGMLDKSRKLKKTVSDIIEKEKPDLIITYDNSGLYGHRDHIAVSEVVTEIALKKKIRLWYASFPMKILKMAKLPEHMAKDEEFKKRRASPNIKVYVWNYTGGKIKALYTYRSQLFAFRKAYPKLMPLWFIVTLWPFEYYHEVKQ